MNKPPFEITVKMLNYIISITEKSSKIDMYESINRMPILRRNNRIKSIHSSLIIEANSLSLEQVYDVIDGKNVFGPIKEIQEVKNAYKAYENIKAFDPNKEKDLLKAHSMLMDIIDDEAGKYRKHAEGVFDGEKVIFVAPPKDMVPTLMNKLFEWLKNDKETPILIKSCVFHYEFVFIHPFGDGNGRTARLWQNVILTSWNPIFEYLPIETYICKYQNEYYRSISNSNINGNSTEFIEFILKVIDEALSEMIESFKKESRNISDKVNRLLDVMEKGIPLSANEIMSRLNIKSKETLRDSYLNPAIKNGLIRMTLEDKPNSKNQKYIK